MQLKESYIYLRNLRFHAFHGIMPQERIVGNDYIVNVRLRYDVSKAMLSDDVNDTLNYASVFDVISQEMAVPSGLLERVAYCMAERLCRKFPGIEAVDVKINKCNPPMGADGDGAGVELHLINDKT